VIGMFRRMAISGLPAVMPRIITGALVVCCCLFTAGQAEASCGDWLVGHADMTSSQELPPDESAVGVFGSVDPQSEKPAPTRPCSGPSCRKAPDFPLIPTDAPGVPLELERDAVLRARGSELSLQAHATILVDDVRFSSASADRLERPPRST
jgi:hypothetical protein